MCERTCVQKYSHVCKNGNVLLGKVSYVYKQKRLHIERFLNDVTAEKFIFVYENPSRRERKRKMNFRLRRLCV
jgi:hypothetical protein